MQAALKASAAHTSLAMVVLVPQAEEPVATTPSVPIPTDVLPGRSLPPERPDPLQHLAAALPVAVRVSDETLELRCGDVEGALDLLETLYVLEGWEVVDGLIGMVERALVLTARDLYPEQTSGGMVTPGDSPRVVMPDYSDPPSGGVAYPIVKHRAPPVNPALTIETLANAAQMEGSRPLVVTALRVVNPSVSTFSYELPRAWVPTGAGDETSLAIRAFAQVLLDLVPARRALVLRNLRSLRAIEREASRQLATFLEYARGDIIRETTRYFTIKKESAVAALENTKSMRLSTERGGEDETLEQGAAQLKKALVELEPLAKRVVKIAVDSHTASTTTSKTFFAGLLSHARAALTREVGRHAQALPVIGRFTARQIVEAKTVGATTLGKTTFEILSRALKANKAMQLRIRSPILITDLIGTEIPRPDLKLADLIQGGKHTTWTYRTYIARAAERVAGANDDFTRRAFEDALNAIGNSGEDGLAQMQQTAGEMLAMGTSSKFATCLVPVLNVGFAAWHILAAVDAYEQQYNEFYCTLNLRDVLVDAPPSASSLALDVGMEAVFAFI